LKEFRKKEGVSQMKLAELCDSTTSYIGHIETGRKFPSMDMIEKMAKNLRIDPYHFFINRFNEQENHTEITDVYPELPKSMKNEIKGKIELAFNEVINEILSKY
jgi:transcriptional regulator with XRE-family HTH domain